MSVLSVSDYQAGYDPDLAIVKGVSFSINKGEAVTILGPNGAGKSTLIKAIAGQVSCLGGQVMLGDDNVTGMPSHALAVRGLGFVPQTDNIFTQLSISENLQIAAELIDKSHRRSQMEKMFDMFPDLTSRRNEQAGTLSGGQRQMLAAARALLTDPSVLILDEPSAGLSPKLVSQVFTTLQGIHATGVTLILVEQNVRAALQITQRALVLVDGELAHDGPTADLLDGKKLGQLFLGNRQEDATA